MSKAVLVSIRPKWCSLIASGKKTIEVRKTRPKLETPFKCYIYQTLPKSGDWNDRDGHVIGEFVCGEVIIDEHRENALLFEQEGCVPFAEQKKYAQEKTLYGWHISDLVIYDEPKQLSELCRWYDGTTDIRPCENGKPCEHEIYDYGEDCRACAIDFDGTDCPFLRVTRPPQSWCYIEEM